MYNWTAIVNIALPASAAGAAGLPAAVAPLPINLITSYGKVMLAKVQAQATVYMGVNG
jgi:hypothetical protein